MLLLRLKYLAVALFVSVVVFLRLGIYFGGNFLINYGFVFMESLPLKCVIQFLPIERKRLL